MRVASSMAVYWYRRVALPSVPISERNVTSTWDVMARDLLRVTMRPHSAAPDPVR